MVECRNFVTLLFKTDLPAPTGHPGEIISVTLQRNSFQDSKNEEMPGLSHQQMFSGGDPRKKKAGLPGEGPA